MYSATVLVNTNGKSTFATDLLLFPSFFLSCCRCGNSDPGKFSLSVSLLARTSEMFILVRYALAISAEGFYYDCTTCSDHILIDALTSLALKVNSRAGTLDEHDECVEVNITKVFFNMCLFSSQQL